MSDFTINDQNSKELFVTYDLSKLFLWDNEYATESLVNSGYSPVTYAPGTVMGRISSTGKITPLVSTASDGSQYPVGILNQGLTLAGGASANVSVGVSGTVAGELLILANGTDTLETTVSNAAGRRIKDLIASQTVGIKIEFSQDLTFGDNV